MNMKEMQDILILLVIFNLILTFCLSTIILDNILMDYLFKDNLQFTPVLITVHKQKNAKKKKRFSRPIYMHYFFRSIISVMENIQNE